MNRVQFTLWEPAGTAPAGGWPVAIFGHGFTDTKDGAPTAVAGTLASNGIATIAINVVGHGGGPLGTYTVSRRESPAVTLPLGGRGFDQNGDGAIDSTEGVSAVGAQSLLGTRDGLRQTTIDLMQLVKVLKGGVDANGDGRPDLSTSRIYYAGQSFGGIYGVQLLGLEPDIRAGVPNVPGGPIIEIARLSPSFRPLVGISLLVPVAVAVQQPGTGSIPHELQREHAVAKSADRDGHRPGRLGDPDPDRQHRVGAAVGESGGLRTVHHRTGDHPVRPRRRNGAEPDGVGDHSRRRSPVADDALPKRPRDRGGTRS